MPANALTDRARAYHAATVHTPASIRRGDHTLDWSIKPEPFKIYSDLPPLPLPRDLPPPARDALAALGAAPAAGALDLERLAGLLFFSAGVTRHRRYPGGGEMYFRAAPSTGALYQTEVYVVAGAVEGLAPGVYHFCPGDFALRRLRAGDYRGALAGAAADEGVGRAPATCVLTAIPWRNTWKYRARGYRHLFWDAGTLLSHALAAAAALDLPARLVTGFVEAEVHALLGLDGRRESALVLLPVGAEGRDAPVSPVIAPIEPRVLPLSAREVDEPLLREAYADSSLDSEAEVAAWREGAGDVARGPSDRLARGSGALDSFESGAQKWPPTPPDARATAGEARVGGWGSAGAISGPPQMDDQSGSHLAQRSRPAALVPLPPPAREAGRSLGETIMRRGSTRQFSGEPIAAGALSAALFHATRPGMPWDVGPAGLVDLYLAVHAVDGLAPGTYAYDRAAHALAPLRAGDVRAESAFLCLEQALGGAGSATVFFLSDLDRVLGALGNRGYRLANLEAGVIGGRLYLAAYAQGFGATGLTFYDDEVVRFFSPHAAGRTALFVTALGRAAGAAPATLIPPPRPRP